ncbi:hypothetical protein [Actinophytocola sp.]|uniref:hypothetical protein n=1 Tax=Actinophytocola sp. TaxID=1872138 RepID=UPI002D34F8C3|nr:hypothetical protein [Actinophytocola sp.]HYQ69733.1 hypothetical protein [Actinophytocola sp.]
MTFDGTKVDVDELKKFGRLAHDRAENTTSAADAVAGVHVSPGMLGVFSLFFLDSTNENQRKLVSNLRTTAATLADDAATATTNAGEVEHTERTQTERFTDGEPR